MLKLFTNILLSGCLLWLPACSPPAPESPEAATDSVAAPEPQDGFVRVDGNRFVLNGQDYAYVGTNLWYGAYLGSPGETGNVERLRSELDFLKSQGITNLRVLGASEASPMKNSLSPATHDKDGNVNEDLLKGLDVLLDEMGKRDMKAVIYLNNFWEWSGGMGTYLSWVNGGHYIDLGDPAHPWPEFPLFNMQFYANADANAIYRAYVEGLLTRTNTVNGRAYADDPAIMAWQLANEPRPGNSTGPGQSVLPEYYAWVQDTSAFIKGLDANHLVSTGSEGVAGCADDADCFLNAHKAPEVDYLTFHMWPKNWSWLKDDDMPGTFDTTLTRAGAYLDAHTAMAMDLGKPIVLEEFGLARDGGSFDLATPTTYRDRFYAFVFSRVEESRAAGGPFAGTNFWTWGGAGRAQHDDYAWQTGDTSYTGDPPQEPQGLNSVFDSDESTLAIIRAHAAALAPAEGD